jgi:hypothetical protein
LKSIRKKKGSCSNIKRWIFYWLKKNIKKKSNNNTFIEEDRGNINALKEGKVEGEVYKVAI